MQQSNQIILGLYTTLINLNPMAHEKEKKEGKRKVALKLSSLLLSGTVRRAMSS
jgi:hypothetical protein